MLYFGIFIRYNFFIFIFLFNMYLHQNLVFMLLELKISRISQKIQTYIKITLIFLSVSPYFLADHFTLCTLPESLKLTNNSSVENISSCSYGPLSQNYA